MAKEIEKYLLGTEAELSSQKIADLKTEHSSKSNSFRTILGKWTEDAEPYPPDSESEQFDLASNPECDCMFFFHSGFGFFFFSFLPTINIFP
jgi:hypothetical protein